MSPSSIPYLPTPLFAPRLGSRRNPRLQSLHLQLRQLFLKSLNLLLSLINQRILPLNFLCLSPQLIVCLIHLPLYSPPFLLVRFHFEFHFIHLLLMSRLVGPNNLIQFLDPTGTILHHLFRRRLECMRFLHLQFKLTILRIELLFPPCHFSLLMFKILEKSLEDLFLAFEFAVHGFEIGVRGVGTVGFVRQFARGNVFLETGVCFGEELGVGGEGFGGRTGDCDDVRFIVVYDGGAVMLGGGLSGEICPSAGRVWTWVFSGEVAGEDRGSLSLGRVFLLTLLLWDCIRCGCCFSLTLFVIECDRFPPCYCSRCFEDASLGWTGGRRLRTKTDLISCQYHTSFKMR
jgi:hypothetical protein